MVQVADSCLPCNWLAVLWINHTPLLVKLMTKLSVSLVFWLNMGNGHTNILLLFPKLLLFRHVFFFKMNERLFLIETQMCNILNRLLHQGLVTYTEISLRSDWWDYELATDRISWFAIWLDGDFFIEPCHLHVHSILACESMWRYIFRFTFLNNQRYVKHGRIS